MIWREARSLGAGRPISSQARWIESTITPAESIRVPSQSKISRSYCLVIQRVQKRSQFSGQRRLDHEVLARNKMIERKFGRMQEHALQPLLGQPPVEFEIAVLVVPRDRKTEMRGMHANLMGATGLQFRFQQGEIGKALQSAENCVRGLPLVTHGHALFALVGDSFVQGQLHVL